jgi:hypothetical protein
MNEERPRPERSPPGRHFTEVEESFANLCANGVAFNFAARFRSLLRFGPTLRQLAMILHSAEAIRGHNSQWRPELSVLWGRASTSMRPRDDNEILFTTVCVRVRIEIEIRWRRRSFVKQPQLVIGDRRRKLLRRLVWNSMRNLRQAKLFLELSQVLIIIHQPPTRLLSINQKLIYQQP